MSIKAILPCSGYGTRVGMQPDESKEMLLHNGFPIIDYSLDLCRMTGIEPVVIVRPEKQDLIKHLELKHGRVERHYYQPTGDMPQTVLDHKHVWGYNNILILPDTRFAPAVQTIQGIIHCLVNVNPLTFAVHKVRDPQNWGIIKGTMINEKPMPMIDGAVYQAWGLIGFNKYSGVELFTGMLEKDVWKPLPKHSILPLESFQDITRGK